MPTMPLVTLAGLNDPDAPVDGGLRQALAATISGAWLLTVDGAVQIVVPRRYPARGGASSSP